MRGRILRLARRGQFDNLQHSARVLPCWFACLFPRCAVALAARPPANRAASLLQRHCHCSFFRVLDRLPQPACAPKTWEADSGRVGSRQGFGGLRSRLSLEVRGRDLRLAFRTPSKHHQLQAVASRLHFSRLAATALPSDFQKSPFEVCGRILRLALRGQHWAVPTFGALAVFFVGSGSVRGVRSHLPARPLASRGAYRARKPPA